MMNNFDSPKTNPRDVAGTQPDQPMDKPTRLYEQIRYMDSVSDHLGKILCEITGKEVPPCDPEEARISVSLMEVLDDGAGMLERLREHQHSQLEELYRLLFRG
jgi:hypothetical protein